MLYGVTGTSLKWFNSYLEDVHNALSVNGNLSLPLSISCGVPQGSILGPLLFLIYINDLPNSLEYATLRMLADDSNATVSGKNAFKVLNNTN